MFNAFELPEYFEAPEYVKNELKLLWNKAYSELYECNLAGIEMTEGELENDILKLLNLFGDPASEEPFKRLMYFHWALCLAVKPRIDAYFSDYIEYESTLDDLEKWASDNYYSPGKIFQVRKLPTGDKCAVAESVSVFQNMLKIPSRKNVIGIIADSLDDCLQGVAICPGGSDNRAIFNWLLIDVFPNAYIHKLPNFIYTMKFDIDKWGYFERTN